MIVWLASYPKSGNTWMRALLANYRADGDEPVDINALGGGPIASARVWFDEWAGVEASCLPQHLVDRLRPDVYRFLRTDVADDTMVMKVHDAWRRTDTGEAMFPADVTRGVVYVVRNPLDVAGSFAHHLHVDLDTAVARMCEPSFTLSDPSGNQLLQRLGTWADHVTSWLDDSGLSVELVRYEDLHADPLETLRRVVAFLGWEVDEARLARAVAHSAFDVLAAQEAEGGFRERAPNAESFFRRGEVGDGHAALSAPQRSRLTGALGATMRCLGYELPTFDHEAFGLVWRTPFFCPGLRAAPAGTAPDVAVTAGPVPTTLDDAAVGEGPWQAAPGRYLFRGGNDVGRFLVADGAITYARTKVVDDARAARIFTDRILVAALQQRGYLVLHANAAAVDGGAVVIAGESGTGKSTTLAALLDRGAQMLCDDICAITLDANGGPVVLPGIAQLHLTEDAAVGLGLTFDDYTLQPWRRMKAAVPTAAEITAGPTRLRSITILAIGDHDGVAVTELSGQAKLDALLAAAYGPLLRDQHPAIFPALSVIASGTPVRVVHRGADGWSVESVLRATLTEDSAIVLGIRGPTD